MRILPFRGYRYNPDRIPNLDDVISLPYDQFKGSRDERFHERHPFNIAHLIMNPETSRDSHSWNRYTRSKSLLDLWMKESIFLRDDQPSIYPYYQDFPLPGGTSVTRKGFVALGEVTDYSRRIVRPHERTMTKPKQDRLELLRSTRVDSGIIFVLYSDPDGEIEALLDEETAPLPAMTANGPDILSNRLWRLSNPAAIARVQRIMRDKPVIIADGHHRYEVAVEFSQEAMRHRSQDPAWDNYRFKLFSFIRQESPAISILPIHRVLRHVEGFEPSRFLQQLESFFSIEATEVDAGVPPARLEEFLERMRLQQAAGHAALGVYLPGLDLLALLTFRGEAAESLDWPGDKSETWRQLDVSILQVAILDRVLNLGERELAQGNFVEYVSDAGEAIKKGADDSCQGVILLNPTPMEQVEAVVEAGDMLPQKTTHFHPKLMEGLVFAKHL
jgi:uncharacterized protein (DUF1015 family)